MRTFRRLDDPTRYYGLSWRGWLAAALAGGLAYLFVRVSPLDARATISVLLVASVLPAMAVFSASGQALGAGRHLAALAGWAAGSKDYAVRHGRTADGGIALDAPPPLAAGGGEHGGWLDLDAVSLDGGEVVDG